MGFQIIESTFDLKRFKPETTFVVFDQEDSVQQIDNELHYYKVKTKEEITDLYLKIFNWAIENNVESIVVPLMPYTEYHSADLYMIAFHTIEEFLSKNELDIYLYIQDFFRVKRNKDIENVLYKDIQSFIPEEKEPVYHHRTTTPVDHPREASNLRNFVSPQISSSYHSWNDFPLEDEIDDLMKDSKEISFGDRLLQLIDEKGYEKYSTLYNKAIVDRRLFHNIISKEGYLPKKNTVILLALALELNVEEAKDFLSYAGYAFSNTKKDQILLHCIENHYYNIMCINGYLYDKGLVPILNIE